jgi:hypothetical protein
MSRTVITWIWWVAVLSMFSGMIVFVVISLNEADKEREAQLVAELKTIPVAEFEENFTRYSELLEISPDNRKYQQKVLFYSEKIKAVERAKRIEREDKAKALAEQKESEKKQKGFHCLSYYDGSHRSIVKYVEKNLRDPDSFEHIETKIWPVTPKGEHQLMMRYRAKNGFGGMTIGKVVATVKNSNCSATITLSE